MTIAVIGHGRSPEGKRWAKHIDACTTVVRMWDWQWQHPADYGTKYDYGLFVLTPKGLSIFMQHNKQVPARGWLAYNGKPVPGKLPGGVPVELLDNPRWHKEIKSTGGAGESGEFSLTRGGAAALWAIENRSGDDVVLVGFDNVCLGVNQSIEDSFNPAYWKLYMDRFKPEVEKVYPLGTSKTATHDLLAEKQYILGAAIRCDVKVLLAQHVWK